MILDNEQQRTIILTIIGQTNFPGQALDTIYALKQAVQQAKVVNIEAAGAAGGGAPGPTGEPGKLGDATGRVEVQPAAPGPGIDRVQAAVKPAPVQKAPAKV